MDVIRAVRRPSGALHRGMVWLLRHHTRWLVEQLIRLGIVPAGAWVIEVLPNEAWPIGEESRNREIRADLVLRLWPGSKPDDPSLEVIRASRVIGIILDFQDHFDPHKGLRLLEYDSAYPPVLGSQLVLIVLTFRDDIARWLMRVLASKHLRMAAHVLTRDRLPRSPTPIDARATPRRAVLEAVIHVRDETDLPLLTNALRALRRFEGNELLIYKEMLMSELSESMIMQAFADLEEEDDDELAKWDDYECTEHEKRSFLFVRGERQGREAGKAEGFASGEARGLDRGRREGRQEGRREGRREGRQEGLREGRARAVLEVLRARGFVIDPAGEAAILAIAAPEALLVRALTVTSVEALLRS